MSILHTDEQRLTLLIDEREWRMVRIKHEQDIIAALDIDITAIRDRKLRAEMGVPHDGRYEVE